METYITQFKSLNTAIQNGKPAPHKAILLLSVIDLIAQGELQSNRITLSDALCKRFRQNWRTYINDGRESKSTLIKTPFRYMNSESFWVTKESANEATIDNRLYELLLSDENRMLLKQVIIGRYLAYNEKYGKFHSWEILSDFVVIKKSDLSVFRYKGSAIPAETKWFWNIESLQGGEKKEFIVHYLDIAYSAYIVVDDMMRARIFWDKVLGRVINELRDEKESFPNLRFKKRSEGVFELSILNAVQKKYVQSDKDTDQTIAEGEILYSHITKYERSAKNRAIAISLHGTKCMACGFDFEKIYGKAGQNYIEVHHVTPLYMQKRRRQIDPHTDLVCVCSNCHSMIHRDRENPLSLEELKMLIDQKRFG